MADAVLLHPVERYWRCPSCLLTERTIKDGVFTQFHACKAFGGANIPLVEVADRDAVPDAEHIAHEREDYMLHPDDPRISSIRTKHADGSIDCTVMAPTARIEINF